MFKQATGSFTVELDAGAMRYLADLAENGHRNATLRYTNDEDKFGVQYKDVTKRLRDAVRQAGVQGGMLDAESIQPKRKTNRRSK